jgi:hypothetical protein
MSAPSALLTARHHARCALRELWGRSARSPHACMRAMHPRRSPPARHDRQPSPLTAPPNNDDDPSWAEEEKKEARVALTRPPVATPSVREACTQPARSRLSTALRDWPPDMMVVGHRRTGQFFFSPTLHTTTHANCVKGADSSWRQHAVNTPLLLQL